MPSRDKILGDKLIAAGLINKEILESAEVEATRTKAPLYKILVKSKAVSADEMLNFLSQELGIEQKNLSQCLIEPEIIKLVDVDFARKKRIIPLYKIDNTLAVAIDDPLNTEAVDELRFKINCPVKPFLVKEDELDQTLDTCYSAKAPEDTSVKEKDFDKPSIVNTVNLIIMQAMKEHASDIHIEPKEKTLAMRFRIDGVLHQRSAPPRYLHEAIISRLKILSNLDIAEKRIPQDGGFKITSADHLIDVRVSIIPSLYGENVVLRLLDRSATPLGLEEIGFAKENLEQFKKVIASSFGIVLVTGPTGSGKTTTLYASLNTIKSEEKNIITIEDPIEYHLDFAKQIQVNTKVNLTFAQGLRSILRHDPDVIMVGEIRDFETAQIAIQAALTGHLVFSTLHTNDAPSAISRLIDMDIEPFLVSSCIKAVLAQRLIRTLCADCKEKIIVREKELYRSLGLEFDKPADKEVTIYQPKGCKLCMHTGFKGRLGIFELMQMTPKINLLAISKASADEIRKAAYESGMVSLRRDGLNRILEGITTIEEVLRVA
ncbi:MAG: GspE/PulE family protein [Candidatus Omnitrophica bacterium]|nr:GspE/PulE family protein [Candidatus Omnitrophota bacterium]MDD5351764.1 GspE/PulE family protein [Candidatus Omnitrophota bacterium]MDD5550975.1 GspE/PulE family protein [Candidatus Omnitrophota bacterium]